MKIIVVGSGKVGYTLSEQLNDEGHEITMIDTNGVKLQKIADTLDVKGIAGNGTSYHIQVEAGVENADLLIAVTNHDEINMLSCLIAKKAGNCQTIARVRDPEYYEEIAFIREELGLSMSINPELAAAEEAARLLQFSSAIDVDTFARGRVNLLRFKIPEGSILHNLRIKDLPGKINMNALICILEHNREVSIPDGNSLLMAGDVVSIIVPMADASQFFQKIGINNKRISSVLIAGGGTIGYYLAKLLLKAKFKVKIIEHNLNRCKTLSELLPEALIIYGDATDQQVLLEEGIRQTDAFVALTDIDEENIMLSLYANQVSKAKLITKINRISFEEVIKEIPIGSVIYPKNITAEHIIRYVRAKQNSLGSNIETLYRMADNRVEALEFIVAENSIVTDKPLEQLKTKDNLLICSIQRGRQLITPSGKDFIKVGDKVIVVTTHLGLSDINDII